MGLNSFGAILVNGLDPTANNYPLTSGNTYVTEPVKGDGLVNRSNGVHTLQISAIKFTGNIQIEATLDTDPITAVFLPVPVTNTVDGTESIQLSYTNADVNCFFTITGQFAWIQANISNIQSGLIQTIKVAY